MKIAADQRNKAYLLGGLMLVAGYLLYSNVFSGPDRPADRTSAAAPSTAESPALPGARARAAALRRAGGAPRIQEFKPSLLPKKGEEPDLATIDPTLRFDLLKRVQSIVGDAGGGRNLFQFTTAPPPPAPKVEAPKIVPKTPQQIAQEQAQQALAAGRTGEVSAAAHQFEILRVP